MTGFIVAHCACGHASGDHQSGGVSRFPHPVLRGRCKVEGCPCEEYVHDPAKDREAA